MGRPISGTMASILAASARKIEWTIDLTFPDASTFHFATAPLTIGLITYVNDAESVREIKQTLESAADKVAFAIQNKDRVLGQHVAAHMDLWRTATAVVGRFYTDADGLGLSEWIEMFRGVVQQPKPDDQTVSTDTLTDTLSPGTIVGQRNEGLPCPFLYKDAKTCGYSGVLPTCDHGLKSANGCDFHGNAHRFGGMEHRQTADQLIPGTILDPGDGGIDPGGGSCPRVDQWTKVKGEEGNAIAIRAGELTLEHLIWDPIDGTFEEIEQVYIVPNVPIFRFETRNGCSSHSSWSHLILPYREHEDGRRVDSFNIGQSVLTEKFGVLLDSVASIAQRTGELGDVVFIHMKKGHRYCSGDAAGDYVVSHNKPIDPLDPR